MFSGNKVLFLNHRSLFTNEFSNCMGILLNEVTRVFSRPFVSDKSAACQLRLALSVVYPHLFIFIYLLVVKGKKERHLYSAPFT